MNNELLEVVRLANREFQEFISQVLQKDVKVVKAHGAVRRLEKISLRLAQISEHLAKNARFSASPAGAESEILKYRENLRTLGTMMDTLQFSLLAERARLEQVQGNLQAASSWAKSFSEIS